MSRNPSRLVFIVAMGLAGPLATVPELAIAQSNTEDEAIEEIVVRGAFYRNYNDLREDTSLGIEVDPMKSPVTAFVLNQDILDDQQINNIDDALRNVAGVTSFKTGNGGEEQFAIHGFRAPLYSDGERRIFGNNRTIVATTETANIDKIVVLKGPASILYGRGEPGGLINYVSKKPQAERYSSTELIVGSEGEQRIEGDTTGAIGNSNFAYRAVVSYEDSETHRDWIFRDRLLVAPSLSYDDGVNDVLLQFEYIDDEYTQTRGQALREDFSLDPYQTTETFFGIPGYNDRSQSEYRKVRVVMGRQLTDAVSVRLSGSRATIDKQFYDAHPRGIDPDSTYTISRADFADSDGTVDALQLDLDSEFQTGALSHHVLASIDYEQQDEAFNRQRFSSPVTYDLASGTFSGLDEFLALVRDTEGDTGPDSQKQRQTGYNIQDLISFGSRDQWHLLLGARWDDYDDISNDLSDSETTWRAGIVYQVSDTTSIYANGSTGYLPQLSFISAANIRNNQPLLPPEIGDQIEIGLKKSLFDGQAMMLLSYYDVTKEDIARQHPSTEGLSFSEIWYTSIGEVNTSGVDLQISGELGSQFRAIVGYSYMDSKIVDSGLIGGESYEGNRLAGIPDHRFSAWGVYEFAGALDGVAAGIGVFSQSDSAIAYDSDVTVPGWAQVDAMVSYKTERWKLQLNARNLGDDIHQLTQEGASASAAIQRSDLSPPRSFVLSVQFEF